MTLILWIVFVLFLLGWGGGMAFHVGGEFIHLLLVVAVIALIYNLLTGTRGTRGPLI